jgi:predicted nucleotidyltransferase
MMGTAASGDGVANLLFGSVRREVLSLLLGRPDNRFYFRELLRAVGRGSGAVQRELQQLVHAGLVIREAEGNQVYFSANRQAQIFNELRAIIEKTAGAADVLRGTLAPFVSKERIECAFVYGSVAAGKQTAKSDIDLLVIGDVSLADLVPALRQAEGKLGREVNVSVYPAPEFRKKLRQGSAFLKRVVKGSKLFVTGDERELERLAR